MVQRPNEQELELRHLVGADARAAIERLQGRRDVIGIELLLHKFRSVGELGIPRDMSPSAEGRRRRRTCLPSVDTQNRGLARGSR